jgi:L-ascorbate metabolism protein UlaG (beta-lactamase superfamily)
MGIRFLGHAAFEITDGDSRILIDPFLAPDNPAAAVSAPRDGGHGGFPLPRPCGLPRRSTSRD